jgi:dihydrofolate reductase
MTPPRISLIVAVADNGVIGRGNDLVWHIPEDLKRFKSLTMEKPVIMGRKTFESIRARLGRALPGRVNIVVSRKNPQYPDALTCRDLPEAIEQAKKTGSDEIFIIGGAQIYAQALEHNIADTIHLTQVHQSPEGDAFFPTLSADVWKETSVEAHDGYDFVVLEKI